MQPIPAARVHAQWASEICGGRPPSPRRCQWLLLLAAWLSSLHWLLVKMHAGTSAAASHPYEVMSHLAKLHCNIGVNLRGAPYMYRQLDIIMITGTKVPRYE